MKVKPPLLRGPFFHINYGKATAVHEIAEWVDYPFLEEEVAPRERSPPRGQKKEKGNHNIGYVGGLGITES